VRQLANAALDRLREEARRPISSEPAEPVIEREASG
jgi:hypothetical protein